ncbi:odorant receptor 22c-like [Culicoides brevitarsis]|uniref:odorant receptor 22c-like n=1 Tax=Culicoides brevitarsis TaxID=469753 RepID=UPI00307CC167
MNSICVLAQYTFAIKHRDNLILVLDCMCPATTMGVTAFKIFMLVWKTKELNGIFDTIKDAFKREVAEKGVSVRKWIPLKGFYSTIFLMSTTGTVALSFFAFPIIFNIQSSIKGVDFVPETMFKSVWPFNHMVTPYMEIIYLYMTYLLFVTQFGISGIDNLFMDIYLHVAALMNILAEDLKSMEKRFLINYKLDSVSKFTKEQNTKFYHEIKRLVKKHQFYLEFCKRVETFFSEIILVHFVSSSFILCMSLMDLLLAPGLIKITYISYIIAATTQVFIYSYAGGQLEEACNNIEVATYGISWYRMDSRNKKLLMKLLMRSQRTVQIKAPFVTASLATFEAIVQAARSYVTLLYTFI